MPFKLVEIRDATVYRGDTRVFSGLSLDIDTGVSTAVLGPNGAGKSTLLQLIAHEVHPLVGPGTRVRVLGRSSWNVFELRSELGLISHELALTYQRDVLGLEVVVSGFFASIGTWDHQEITPAHFEASRAVMARLGISLPVIEKVLNHSSGSFAGIVGVYQRHSFADEKRHALNTWGAFVTDLVSNRPRRNVVRLRKSGRRA